MTTTEAKPFILVFRPHQPDAWACWFETEEEFFADGSHDLSGLTRLDSADEVRRYLHERDYAGHHNKGYGPVMRCAKKLGWITDPDKEEEDE